MVTIEQLQEIVYQNAIGIAELREAQKKTDEQLKELKERMDQTDKQIKATEEQLKKTDEQLKKTDEQLKKTDEQMNRTDVRLNKIAKLVGNMSNNQGEVAEEYFVNSLKDVLKIIKSKKEYVSMFKDAYPNKLINIDLIVKAIAQFERTLIIADEGSEVSYLEGCTAPMRDEN